MNHHPSSHSVPVSLVSILTHLEAAVVGFYGIAIMATALAQGGAGVGSAMMLGLFFVVVAAVMLWAARLFTHGRGASRAMVLVWQLFIIIIGMQIALAGQWLIGIPAVAIAGIITVSLFTRAVHSHLDDARRDSL
ncbi:hypothetical protein VVR12_00710 [Rothia sp. LK2588]|uniref:hypothetical protein n=1 Tax=Rothia sp. LK2588 TaxID=3114369 RepID=UPI0034CE135A